MTVPTSDTRTGERRTYVVVTHSHLDREWYRTAEAFQARLADTVDVVLDRIAADPSFVFVLDGQTVVLEDYLQLRPHRQADLVAAAKSGQLSFGPWYVQPDGFIPAAESIVRNLLEGRAVGLGYGAMSRVGYLPDTFGHPRQLPMILRGFDLDGFCFRRGVDDEVAALPSEFVWRATDGTQILAIYLAEGYGNAAFLPPEVDEASARLARLGDRLVDLSTGSTVAFMNGCDHTLPIDQEEIFRQVADRSGARVIHGTVDDVVAAFLDRIGELPVHTGELRGARGDALLHGVLSTRSYLKLANAQCEAALYGWAEPFAALAAAAGGPDEAASLRLCRRTLLVNHAHDSLCGTSIDPVHRAMEVRFRQVDELATLTAERAMSFIAGGTVSRVSDWDNGVDLAVFNPTPHSVSGVVTHWFDADPPYAVHEAADGRRQLGNPPLLAAVLAADGFEVDGHPARRASRPNERLFAWTETSDVGVEFPVTDVPAYGWKRVRLTSSRAHDDMVDDGRVIESGSVRVEIAPDGTATLSSAGRSWSGLVGLVDEGDRGDSYDISPVEPFVRGGAVVDVVRRQHPSGLASLRVTRRLTLPRGLHSDDKARRDGETVDVDVVTTYRVGPHDRVDVEVEVENLADNHRLRLAFPTGPAGADSIAENAYDVIRRPARPTSSGKGWIGPPPATFPAHGFVTVDGSGLAVAAPGLVECEVDAGGSLLLTLFRSTGLLSDKLPERGVPGPVMRIPDAQCHRNVRARLSLLPYTDVDTLPQRALVARLGLTAVVATEAAVIESGRAVLATDNDIVCVTAVKPAEAGPGLIVRLWNPSGTTQSVTLRSELEVREATSVRLDEQPDGGQVATRPQEVSIDVPAFGVRSVRLMLGRPA